ncbi:hypothetical protein A6769_12100 [Nostoc punctiforme NIES-2108]|uniref:Uncharacterized protein n=1 Tax=Nostoc punctiforme NIES-2108 TaxID=1356359 RepID=A0A367RM45_NOSPU|nr:hypothetical protein A6769_12100 [Nostoc punctiforme NIES-2108]
MTKKYKISAKDVDTRILAIYALDHFIEYVRTTCSDINPSEATLLAAITLHSLPELFQENPLLVNRFREAAAHIKGKKRNPQSPDSN